MREEYDDLDCRGCGESEKLVSNDFSYKGDGIWAELITCGNCGELMTDLHKAEVLDDENLAKETVEA